MKKFLKNDLYIIITLLFIVLIFKHNVLFKNCIINGATIFFHQVFPTLFPAFLINDILISCNFIFYLNKWLNKIFYKLFHFSNAATYIFIMSIFSGTPTNGYITANLVNNNNLNIKDASIILTYSFFLNPLFLFTMLSFILNQKEALKLILISYSINFFIALFYRNYNYENIKLDYKMNNNSFSTILTSSINHAFSTLIIILGTMIFYFIICEGINLFIVNNNLNCLINGILEVTGGLSKLSNLNINFFLKKIIAISFISFGGLSIHSQIKSIIVDANISYKPFFKARIIHMILSTITCIITS